MGWFDKIKQFIKVDIKGPLFQVNVTNDKSSRIDLKFESGICYEDKKGIIHFDISKLPKEAKEQLPKIIQEYLNEGNRLLEHKTSDLLERLYRYNKEKPDEAILSFFRQIIPFYDFEALEASLFLRNEFRRNNDVSEIKKGIRRRFGDRGNNISNLCTAGYFEEFLLPLFNSSQEDFHKVYEDIVSKTIVAVFVHQGTDPDNIPIEISRKIEISKKYGIKFIHVHGISRGNVDKIKRCIKEKQEYFNYYEKKIFENMEKDIIVVELLFK